MEKDTIQKFYEEVYTEYTSDASGTFDSYEGHKTPIWNWQHIRYFNKNEIQKFLKICGFHKEFAFYGAERRQPFATLSRYFPSFLGSVMVVEVRK